MTQVRIPLILILCTTPGFCASCGTNSGPSTSAQGTASPTPTIEVVKVTSKKLSMATRLPGELQAYEAVAVFPKVTAYVDSISVDRGSRVKAGQLRARLGAAEVAAQRADAQSKRQAAEAQPAEAGANVAAKQSTY